MFRSLAATVGLVALAAAFVRGNATPLTGSEAGATALASQMGETSFAPAPYDFDDIYRWINSPPLSMRDLRGKVVLVDFWAYSCINCLRTLPYLTRWYDTYRDKGFVIVGVHTPEFDFGKDAANVERAVRHFRIRYPVAMDNDEQTWIAWKNQYWPEDYLVNRSGQIVLTHVGEGGYAAMEAAIRQQLGLPPLASPDVHDADDPNLVNVRSPEMYLGGYRLENLANPVADPKQASDYRAPAALPLNRFALQGRWRLAKTCAELTGAPGAIRLHFDAGSVYMVAGSQSPITLSISVDGKPQPPVTVQADRMYTLFTSDAYSEHRITIRVPQPGLHAYTFTFG